MATLALGTLGVSVAGAAFPATTLGIFGATATSAAFALGGGLIDSLYLFPAILPTPDQEGRRIESIRGPAIREDEPRPLMLGPSNRTGGCIIWLPSTLIEEESVETVGGKGTTPTEVTTYKYFTHVAVALCEGQIDDVTRIWANGELLWKRILQDISLSSSQLSVATSSQFGGFLPGFQVINSPNGGPDLTTFKRGALTTTSGFSNGANNITSIAVHKGQNEDGSTYLVIINPFCVTEAAGATVTITQLAIDLFPYRPDRVQDVRIYKGSSTQFADVLLGLYSLPYGVPAYRGTAYVVIQKLALEDFGNHIPTLSFEVKADSIKTVGQAITSIMTRAGIDASEYFVGGLDESVRGMIINLDSPVESLRALMRAYNVSAREVEGVLTFIKRGTERLVDLNTARLAAHEADEDTPRVISITDEPGFDLPHEVNVSYIDINKDYSVSSQRERRIDQVASTSMSFQLPLTLTAIEARAIARRELYAAWTNRQTVHLFLPPSYMDLNEHDVLKIVFEDRTLYVLVTQITRGNNYLLEVEGLIEPSEPMEFETPVDEVDDTQDEIPAPPYLAMGFIDIAPFTSVDVNQCGVYFAIAAVDPDDIWTGAAIYQSTTTDDDDEYSLQATVPSESPMGIATEALADGPVGYWDYENTVQVEMFNGTLESKSAAQVLAGQNWAVLGDEVIAFQTATLVDTYTYELSGLLRGLRGTETETGGHAVSDRFIPLPVTAWRFVPYSTALLGSTLYHRPVASGQNIENVEGLEHTLNGGTVTPFSVANLRQSRDGSDNVTATWDYRTQYPYQMFGPAVPPLPSYDERYDVEWYAGGSLQRTETVEDRTATYTAAEQTADGVTPGDDIAMIVYQRGQFVDRGPGRAFGIGGGFSSGFSEGFG